MIHHSSFLKWVATSTFFVAGMMKYIVFSMLSALVAVYLQRSEDPLIPVGTLVETIRSYCGSAFLRLQSFAGLADSLFCVIIFKQYSHILDVLSVEFKK